VHTFLNCGGSASRTHRDPYPMKKKTPSLDIGTKYPVVLWYEDLERVHEIISELSTEISIESKAHEFEALSEISELPKKELHELRFSVSKPSMTVYFSPYHVHIYGSEDAPAPRGIAEKLRAFLATRKRRLVRLQTSSIGGIALIVAAFNMPSLLGHKGIFAVLASMVGGLLLGAAWLVRVWWLEMRVFSTIRPWRRAESPPFLQRNQNAIALILITAVVTASVTVFVQWLAARMLPAAPH
jgi:hypothetical protein